jgi:DNA-binding response OmpR family regulator
MVVDYEADTTLTFKHVLEDHGFAVDTYENSQQALHDFEAEVYDIVILDNINTGVLLESYDACRRLVFCKAAGKFVFYQSIIDLSLVILSPFLAIA